MSGDKTLNIRVPFEIYSEFNRRVRIRNITKTQVVVDLLKMWLEITSLTDEDDNRMSKEERKEIQQGLKDKEYDALEIIKRVKKELNIV